MAILDASVYLALINNHESEHAASWRWFRQAQNNREIISAPVILLAETAVTLSRGMGNTALAHRVVTQLSESPLINLVPVTADLAKRAASIAADYQIRGCDAVYVALAAQLDDYLMTLDKQQLDRGANIITTRQPK